MSHKKTNLKARVCKAKAAVPFISVLQNDKAGRLRNAVVPGSDGKQYDVILWREHGGIQAECNLKTSGGGVNCQGAESTVCYHMIAAVIKAAGDRKVAFCQNEPDARRLANVLHADVFKVASRWHSERKLWLVT